MARFLGKMSLEAVALVDLNSGIDFNRIVLRKELDGLREFVRFGKSSRPWQFYERKIYPENFVFRDNQHNYYEISQEYKFLYTKSKELYFIFACFGVEYSINLGGHYVDGYIKWLDENNYLSPLHTEDVEKKIPKFFFNKGEVRSS
jgi:hypothetical protein